MPLSENNRVESVKSRLRNIARDIGINPNAIHTRYALERFLYRLSLTEHKNRITLKGGLLFFMWCQDTFRPTKDADFLISGDKEEESIKQAIAEICDVNVPVDDAMKFDSNTIRAFTIKEEEEYQGIRITLKSNLGNIPIPIQIDIGTGDVVTPYAIETDYTILIDELPPPNLKVYNKETVIAEKLHAMVNLDITNSRMKDFYDVWMITTKFDYDEKVLIKAISATFKRRDTEFPIEGITSLTEYFHGNKAKQTQWKAFVRKNNIEPNDLSLEQVSLEIQNSLQKTFKSLSNK